MSEYDDCDFVTDVGEGLELPPDPFDWTGWEGVVFELEDADG